MQIGVIVATLLLCLFSASEIHASGEFTTEYNSSYVVQENGTTSVEHKVSITNEVSNVFADEFVMSIGLPGITNVKVETGKRVLKPEIKRTEWQTTINVEFLDKVVGKGKTNEFVISYETESVAVDNAGVWEVNLPQLAGGEVVDRQRAELYVPISWGDPTLIFPSPDGIGLVEGLRRFRFEKIDSEHTVTATFGRDQWWKLTKVVKLSNPGVIRQIKELRLIPQSTRQSVIYKSLDPKPIGVRVDESGNWWGQYELEGAESITARMEVYVQSHSTNDLDGDYIEADSGKWSEVSEDEVVLANKLGTPERIFSYVVDSAEQLSSSNWFGITDSYMKLLRAADIPARVLVGWVWSNNEDVRPYTLGTGRHLWVEVFDKEMGKWVQTDPIWTYTSGVSYYDNLGLNHLLEVVDTDGSLSSQTEEVLEHGMIAERPEATGSGNLSFESKTVGIFRWRTLLKVTNESGVVLAPEVSWASSPAGIIRGEGVLPAIPPWGNGEIEIGRGWFWQRSSVNGWVVEYEGDKYAVTNTKYDKSESSPSLEWWAAVGLAVLGASTIWSFRVLLRGRK